MAKKILGQSNPSATTETDLYTVPASTETVVSSLTICNQGNENHAIRVSVSADGAATSDKDYIYKDLDIPAGDTFVATIGITLDATDKVRVYADSADISFNLFGDETAV